MFSRRLTVSVPTPCHEKWQDMTPAAQGRFCQSCAKTVVDFTGMSDAEVVKWPATSTGKTCGKLTSTQLSRELSPPSQVRKYWTWKAAMLALATWLSIKPASAKLITPNAILEQQAQPNLASAFSVPEPNHQAPDSLAIIRGTVLSLATKEEMPGVTVFIKGTNIGTTSGRDGKFILAVPDTFNISEAVVAFAFIGYKTQEKKLVELQKQSHNLISMAEDAFIIGEVVMTRYRWYSPRGMYYRIKNLFR